MKYRPMLPHFLNLHFLLKSFSSLYVAVYWFYVCGFPLILVNREFQAGYRSGISFVVSSDDPVTNINDIRRIYHERHDWLKAQVFYDTSRMQHVTATMLYITDVMGKLLKFSKTYPRVLSNDLLALVDAYLVTPQFTTNVFINGLDIRATDHYDVTVTCRLQSPYTCEVQVTKLLT